mmetsp:Transcript_3903/g.7546  ORF Transcript_3903/g.7546 Transcript_3903/m.7546 type:complete len:200 (-) Transcript_3903:132-731(-)
MSSRVLLFNSKLATASSKALVDSLYWPVMRSNALLFSSRSSCACASSAWACALLRDAAFSFSFSFATCSADPSSLVSICFWFASAFAHCSSSSRTRFSAFSRPARASSSSDCLGSAVISRAVLSDSTCCFKDSICCSISLFSHRSSSFIPEFAAEAILSENYQKTGHSRLFKVEKAWNHLANDFLSVAALKGLLRGDRL